MIHKKRKILTNKGGEKDNKIRITNLSISGNKS